MGIQREDRIPPSEPLPVSVVIPAYNRSQLVRRALASVAAQTPRPPAEVIVVDDCSSDDTAAAAAEMGASVIRHEVNRGEGAARNSGLRAATHDWVALLDSDDEWLPSYLRTLWPLRDGHVLVSGSALYHHDDGSKPPRFHGAVTRHPRVFRSPVELVYPGNVIPASGVMVRRDVVLECGGYREGMPHAADFDLYLRVLEHGTGLITPEPVVAYHVHAGQVSGDQDAMHRAHRDVAESYAHRPWWNQRRLERRLGVQAWDEFRQALREGDRRLAAGRATWIARHIQPALGVLGIWALRFFERRRTSALMRDRGPSVGVPAGQGMGDHSPPPR